MVAGVLIIATGQPVWDLVVALARGSWALTTPRLETGPSRLVAYNGSLIATELAIPLLAARGQSLG